MWYRGDGCSLGFWSWFPGHGLAGSLLQILLFVALALLLYKMLRSFLRPRTTQPPENRDAMDSLVILDRRLAEGKISQEEYRNIREILGR